MAEIDELLGGHNHSSPAGEVTLQMAKEDGEVGYLAYFTAPTKPSTPNAEAVGDRREEEGLATTSSSEEEELRLHSGCQTRTFISLTKAGLEGIIL